MLQRTRIASGMPYYERFLKRFPDVETLAAATEEDVLRAWEGLGFYRRARNLHAAAKAIVRDHEGRIPRDAATLATLPGIGPYTAGAVASIAFGEPAPAVDGNVTRVLSRIFRVEADVTKPSGRARLEELARGLVTADRPGAFNQALMDLGSTVCAPRRPACAVCPVASLCRAKAAGVQSSLPRMPARRRPETVPVSFAYVRARGRTLLVRRPNADLLGGLWALPGGEVPSERSARDTLRHLVTAQAGIRVLVREEVARVAHTFSHLRWSATVFRCTLRGGAHVSPSARWATDDELAHLPLVPDHRKLLGELASRRSLESFGVPGRPRGT